MLSFCLLESPVFPAVLLKQKGQVSRRIVSYHPPTFLGSGAPRGDRWHSGRRFFGLLSVQDFLVWPPDLSRVDIMKKKTHEGQSLNRDSGCYFQGSAVEFLHSPFCSKVVTSCKLKQRTSNKIRLDHRRHKRYDRARFSNPATRCAADKDVACAGLKMATQVPDARPRAKGLTWPRTSVPKRPQLFRHWTSRVGSPKSCSPRRSGSGSHDTASRSRPTKRCK